MQHHTIFVLHLSLVLSSWYWYLILCALDTVMHTCTLWIMYVYNNTYIHMYMYMYIIADNTYIVCTLYVIRDLGWLSLTSHAGDH